MPLHRSDSLTLIFPYKMYHFRSAAAANPQSKAFFPLVDVLHPGEEMGFSAAPATDLSPLATKLARRSAAS